jgi:hypothetical protein
MVSFANVTLLALSSFKDNAGLQLIFSTIEYPIRFILQSNSTLFDWLTSILGQPLLLF